MFSALLLTASAAVARDTRDWHGEGRALLAEAVAIPTVQGRGEVQRLVKVLRAKFESAGINDIVVKDYDGTQAMIVRWRAEGKPRVKPILLLGHLDVVEAKRDDWTRDPFILGEADGYFYGRGTLDMKSGVVAITNALLRLKAQGFKPKRDIIVLFTGDEEIGARGARLAATEWHELVDAEFALNADMGGGIVLADGKSAGFRIQTSEKSVQVFMLTVHNPGGHSSRPRPDNAIYELAAALDKLKTLRFTPHLNATTRAYFTARQAQEQGPLGDAMRRWLADEKDGASADLIEATPNEVGMTRTTCVATRLSAGHANNALPQTAEATINCRLMPGDKSDAIKDEIQAAVGPGVAVTPMYAGLSIPVSPLTLQIRAAYSRAVHAQHPGEAIYPYMSTGGTDGAAFRVYGMPVYGTDGIWLISPVDERAHGRDERIAAKAFYANLDHWHALVKDLAGSAR